MSYMIKIYKNIRGKKFYLNSSLGMTESDACSFCLLARDDGYILSSNKSFLSIKNGGLLWEDSPSIIKIHKKIKGSSIVYHEPIVLLLPDDHVLYYVPSLVPIGGKVTCCKLSPKGITIDNISNEFYLEKATFTSFKDNEELLRESRNKNTKIVISGVVMLMLLGVMYYISSDRSIDITDMTGRLQDHSRGIKWTSVMMMILVMLINNMKRVT